jgi:hypothetical protein
MYWVFNEFKRRTTSDSTWLHFIYLQYINDAVSNLYNIASKFFMILSKELVNIFKEPIVASFMYYSNIQYFPGWTEDFNQFTSLLSLYLSKY